MKRMFNILWLAPVILATGCVSHRYPAAVATVHPGEEVVVVPAPVSDRPVMRVYPEPIVPSTALPAGVSATEHAIADRIRLMFNADPDWRSLTDRVEARVSNTTVVLRGVVSNDAVRDRVEQKVRAIDGVTAVDNGLTALDD